VVLIVIIDVTTTIHPYSLWKRQPMWCFLLLFSLHPCLVLDLTCFIYCANMVLISSVTICLFPNFLISSLMLNSLLLSLMVPYTREYQVWEWSFIFLSKYFHKVLKGYHKNGVTKLHKFFKRFFTKSDLVY